VSWNYRDVVRTVPFWAMLLALTGGSAGYTLFLAHGIVHLKDLGHTAAEGAWAIGILSISSLLAKLLIAALGDRLDPRYLWGVFTLVFGIGLVIVVDARSPLLVFMFSACIGIGSAAACVHDGGAGSTESGLAGLSGLATHSTPAQRDDRRQSAVRPGFGYAGSFTPPPPGASPAAQLLRCGGHPG
jgi:MFS family permease